MLLISVEDIQRGIGAAEPQLEKLQTLYGSLPETLCRCERPGECCMFLPQMTWMEALQWFRHLLALGPADRESMVRKFIGFFLSNPVQRSHCPFLSDDGGCGNYDVRPFACRAYGMWSVKWGRERTKQSREGKKALVAMWRRYGVELPKDAVTHEIDYCDKVAVLGKTPMTDSRLMKRLSRVHQLDDAQPEPKQRFEEGHQSDFSALMTALVWGGVKTNLNKYAVIKDLVQKGSDRRLKNFLANAADPF